MTNQDMRNAIAAQCGFKDSKAAWIETPTACYLVGEITPSKANEHDCNKCGEHFSTCICPDWPSIEEQEQYWKDKDANLDRTESNAQWIDERDRDLEHESRVDYESWQTDNE